MGEAAGRTDTPPMSPDLIVTAAEVVLGLGVAMGVLLVRP
jgi:hypothetical protein